MLGDLHAGGALAADFQRLIPLQRHGPGLAPRVFLGIGQLRVGAGLALQHSPFAGGHGLLGGAQRGVALHGKSLCGRQCDAIAGRC